MVNVQEHIDQRIEGRFEIIENKLRNSFQAIKQDNDFIKKKIQELNTIFEGSNSKKVLNEFDKFRGDITIDFNDIKKTLTTDVSALRKEINKKNIKEDVKTTLRKEVYSEFEKRIDKKFEKFENCSKDIKSDFTFHKKDIQKQVDCMGERVNDFQDSINKNVELAASTTVKEVKTQNSSLKSDVSKWKKYFSERIDEDLKARDEKITKLERQIAYLKGRINSNSEQEFVVEVTKEKEVKKSANVKVDQKKNAILEKRTKLREMFANIVNSLADSDSEVKSKPVEKKKEAYVSVIKPLENKKKIVISKKLEKTNDKSFISKIVDSLSD